MLANTMTATNGQALGATGIARSPKWLRDVTPRLAVHDTTNSLAADSVSASNFALRNARLDKPSNVGNGGSRQHGLSVCFSLDMSPLAHTIALVIGRRTQEQMTGIHAQPIVAVVADEQSIRDSAVVQFPRETMGQVVRLSARGSDLSVPARGCASPQPAIVSLVDFSPKPIREWLRSRLIRTRTRTVCRTAPFDSAREDVKCHAAVLASSGNATLGWHQSLLTAGVVPGTVQPVARRFVACQLYDRGGADGRTCK